MYIYYSFQLKFWSKLSRHSLRSHEMEAVIPAAIAGTVFMTLRQVMKWVLFPLIHTWWHWVSKTASPSPRWDSRLDLKHSSSHCASGLVLHAIHTGKEQIVEYSPNFCNPHFPYKGWQDSSGEAARLCKGEDPSSVLWRVQLSALYSPCDLEHKTFPSFSFLFHKVRLIIGFSWRPNGIMDLQRLFNAWHIKLFNISIKLATHLDLIISLSYINMKIRPSMQLVLIRSRLCGICNQDSTCVTSSQHG